MKRRGHLIDVTIRAVRPDDKARIVEAFRALEPRSIYLRFFSHKKELSSEELRQVTEPDRARGVVLVATIGSGDQEIIIGLGEYVRSGPGAEIAFAVEEDYQGRGIASRLLQQLAQLARENGVLQFEAHVLADNTPMLNVFHHSGLRMRESVSDGIVHVTLFLGNGPVGARPMRKGAVYARSGGNVLN
jgi:GNAT superfamily N-acetyltransferase